MNFKVVKLYTGSRAVPEKSGFTGSSLQTPAFEQLASSLSGVLQSERSRVVTFMGAAARVGTSTVCEGLARSLAGSGEKVFLIRLSGDSASRPAVEINGWADIVPLARETDGNPFMIVDISVSQIPQSAASHQAFFSELLKGLQKEFTRIIWDVPPAEQCPLSRVVARYSDGVVLVVHAGRTRWHAAKHSMESLQFSGARILGVVLNRKKMYIPGWIYRLLFRRIG